MRERWLQENAAIVGNVNSIKRQLGFDILERINNAKSIMEQVYAVDTGPDALLRTPS